MGFFHIGYLQGIDLYQMPRNGVSYESYRNYV